MTQLDTQQKSGRRGKKACIGCGKLVGVRLRKCECGFDFSSVVESPIEPIKVTSAPVAKTYILNTNPIHVFRKTETARCMRGTLLTPAGTCPVILSDFSEGGIKLWATKVLNILMRESGYKSIAVDALEYWAKIYYRGRSGASLPKLIRDTLINLTKEVEF